MKSAYFGENGLVVVFVKWKVVERRRYGCLARKCGLRHDLAHLPLKDFTKANNRELTTANTVSNYNGTSKDSPKEINEKE
jgi:hypothetical protein